jgi:hypothetical protein
MDSSDTESLHAPNDDEMGRLVLIALEEFGAGLNRPTYSRRSAG